jgi:hypothetical protein
MCERFLTLTHKDISREIYIITGDKGMGRATVVHRFWAFKTLDIKNKNMLCIQCDFRMYGNVFYHILCQVFSYLDYRLWINQKRWFNPFDPAYRLSLALVLIGW